MSMQGRKNCTTCQILQISFSYLSRSLNSVTQGIDHVSDNAVMSSFDESSGNSLWIYFVMWFRFMQKICGYILSQYIACYMLWQNWNQYTKLLMTVLRFGDPEHHWWALIRLKYMSSDWNNDNADLSIVLFMTTSQQLAGKMVSPTTSGYPADVIS